MEGKRPIPEAARATERLAVSATDLLTDFREGRLRIQIEVVRYLPPKLIVSAVKQ